MPARLRADNSSMEGGSWVVNGDGVRAQERSEGRRGGGGKEDQNIT